MKLIEADKVEQAIKDYWKAQVDKALTLTDGNEKRINIYLEHNHELLKAIDELPPVQPDTTTHDSIPAETGKNDGDRTSGDCISRQQTFDALHCRFADGFEEDRWWNSTHVIATLKELPSVQPERKDAIEKAVAVEAISDELMSRFDISATYAYEIAEKAMNRIEAMAKELERGEQE